MIANARWRPASAGTGTSTVPSGDRRSRHRRLRPVDLPADEVTVALTSLSPAHREILDQTVLRNRSVNDAAAALGVPVATVKSRVYHALRALHAALEERGATA
ncbi:sigma factor-like helix-turn-helix DNA-binding protein [Streptosporangium longisporum]|uniref:RNA polymerase sigma-70 region 4 domain-containing protein n=1 Tax=Streptosporangium longisporum TaxID=46187 RepID=A0ABN3XWG9_9ACTN